MSDCREAYREISSLSVIPPHGFSLPPGHWRDATTALGQQVQDMYRRRLRKHSYTRVIEYCLILMPPEPCKRTCATATPMNHQIDIFSISPFILSGNEGLLSTIRELGPLLQINSVLAVKSIQTTWSLTCGDASPMPKGRAAGRGRGRACTTDSRGTTGGWA